MLPNKLLFAGDCIPAATFEDIPIGADIGGVIVFPNRVERSDGLIAVDNVTHADLIGPVLPHELLDGTSVVGTGASG